MEENYIIFREGGGDYWIGDPIKFNSDTREYNILLNAPKSNFFGDYIQIYENGILKESKQVKRMPDLFN